MSPASSVGPLLGREAGLVLGEIDWGNDISIRANGEMRARMLLAPKYEKDFSCQRGGLKAS